jgi:hypothetical protein
MTFLDHFCKLSCRSELLDNKSNQVFHERISELNSSNSTIIYRGINKRKLMEIYNVYEEKFPFEISEKLFMVGAKSNRYLTSTCSFGYAIDDCSEKLFEDIFKMINNVLLPSKPSSTVQRFKDRERNLASYFESLDNLTKFVSSINALPNSDKINARDYYISLLHHIEDKDFHPNSFLLSVSKMFGVANRFAGRGDNKVILLGWVPEQNKNIIFDYLNDNIISLLKINKLPTYSESFYPHEYEISLKGGIFPHFLIGFLFWQNGNKYFEINPALLENTGGSWINRGFIINQSKFEDIIKHTQYNKYFEAVRGNYNDNAVNT